MEKSKEYRTFQTTTKMGRRKKKPVSIEKADHLKTNYWDKSLLAARKPIPSIGYL